MLNLFLIVLRAVCPLIEANGEAFGDQAAQKDLPGGLSAPGLGGRGIF